MYQLVELWEFVRDYIASGGQVMAFILFVLTLMMFLAVERFIYLQFVYPKLARQIISDWHAREDTRSWYAHRVRDAWLSQINAELSRGLSMLKTLVAIAPLIGLLGTVWGMINVFEALAQQGSGNARLMANGISMATIPTMSGMVCAIAGIFVSHRLESQARNRAEQLADSLVYH